MDNPTSKLLQRAIRAFEEDLAHRLRQVGVEQITASRFQLLRHLDADGMTITELARNAGISKQAVSQALGPLVRDGMVQVTPKPNDGRSRLVRWTALGSRLQRTALEAVGSIEADYEQLLGQEDYATLRDALTTLASRPHAR
ncbi:MAG: MarR family transcriptional regulator [Myxococcales bacterium]|nr:MarR family transcriptional regulator [Myxococcales bacterium]